MSSVLLSLPPEVRNIIYHYYLTEPDGYHYDYDSCKFRKSDGSKIDLSLTYTCKLVASEMHFFAFEKNALVFSTFDPQDQLLAARIHWILNHTTIESINHIQWPQTKWHRGSRKIRELYRYINPEVKAKVVSRYPESEKFLPSSPKEWERMSRQKNHIPQDPGHYGQAWSRHLEFCNYLIKTLAVEAGYSDSDTYKSPFYSSWAKNPPTFLTPNIWDILSEEELVAMEEATGWRLLKDEPDVVDEYICFYSATQGAIQFLKSVSENVRLKLRRIIVNEDRDAGFMSACHATGLIPYSLENQYLHIERRVNIWKTVLAGEINLQAARAVIENIRLPWYLEGWETKGIRTSRISISFAQWITEARVLFERGMPAGSFSLVFDGGSAPDQCADLFEIVKRDAAWQDAMENWLVAKGLTIPVRARYDDHWCRPFCIEGFSSMVNDIVDGKSIVRCDFATGERYIKDLFSFQDREAQSYDWWKSHWEQEHDDMFIQTSSPLPSLWEMKLFEIHPRLPGPYYFHDPENPPPYDPDAGYLNGPDFESESEADF